MPSLLRMKKCLYFYCEKTRFNSMYQVAKIGKMITLKIVGRMSAMQFNQIFLCIC